MRLSELIFALVIVLAAAGVGYVAGYNAAKDCECKPACECKPDCCSKCK